MNLFLMYCILIAFVFAMFSVMIHTEKTRQENQLKEAYLLSMQEFYEVIQSQLKAVRRYRHDLAGHIQTLEWILKQRGDSSEIKEYMGNLEARYQKLKKTRYCRNEILDSVLVLKKQQCEAKQIPLDIQVEDTSYDDIAEFDMVGILHNLLNNAIEENERIPAEFPHGIWFSMGRKEQTIWIEVRNRIQPGVKVTFYTKKANKEEHGIGIKIIDSLIEKYHGKRETDTDEETNLFRCRVSLTIQENEAGRMVSDE